MAAWLWAWFVVVGCVMAGCSGPRESENPTGSPTFEAAPVTPEGNAGIPVRWDKVVDGLSSPVYVTSAPGDPDRLFIVEQAGRILVLRNGALLPVPFLDIRSAVASGGERGLLSVAFHPAYDANGVFVVDYTRLSANGDDNGDTVIARYTVNFLNRDLADPTTGETLLIIDQPQANHNGGLALWGPDGHLYIGTGDGGAGGDSGSGHAVGGNGQSLGTLLGKMLRIDVGPSGAYTIPAGNPFQGGDQKREIWAYGLRNPWRFSFDRATGDLFIGDVGQGAWEEIDYQPAGSKGGENYGWNVFEGSHTYRSGTAPGHVMPVAEYDHRNDRCSVTAGHVYRGKAVPALAGRLVLADYCSGEVWALAHVNNAWSLGLLTTVDMNPSSFGEDAARELYMMDHSGGGLYRLAPG